MVESTYESLCFWLFSCYLTDAFGGYGFSW